MVDLKYSITHREPHYPVLQFLEEDLTAVVEVLVVHAYRQYKMKKLPYRDTLSPRHVGTCLEGIVHIVKVKVGRIVSDIRQRHICIHELHCLALLGSERPVKDGKILLVPESLAAVLEITCYFTLFIEVFLCMELPEGKQCDYCCKQYRNGLFHIVGF